MKKFWVMGLVSALLLALAAPGVMAAEQKFIRMFSGPEGGSWYPLGAAMMSVLEKKIPGISTSNGPGGGVGNCKAVHAKRADLGWTYTHTSYAAIQGLHPFDKKYDNIRHLMSLYPGVFQMAVPRNSDIKSPADMANKRIVPGVTGFTGTIIAEQVLQAYDLTFDKIKQNGGTVTFVGYADSAALLKDGHSDVYMAVTSLPQATILDLNFQPGIRLIGVDDAHMKKILEIEPGLMPYTVPPNTYDGQTAPVLTPATVTQIIVGKDVPDEMVYQIVKTLYDSWPELAQVKKKDIEDSKPDQALLGNRIEVHPGALKYYKEKGYAK
ncbi:MAG: TAXI family TRAP transporter solute-binding subunit [Desulfarculus sp.]|nr:TAXI family TRAP transporter solute-binding subunit [Desulfarculus sp.]